MNPTLRRLSQLLSHSPDLAGNQCNSKAEDASLRSHVAVSVRLMEGDGGTIWTSPALDFALKCCSQTTHPVFIPPDSGEQLLWEGDGLPSCPPHAYLRSRGPTPHTQQPCPIGIDWSDAGGVIPSCAAASLSSRPPHRAAPHLVTLSFFMRNEIDSFVGSCRK